MDIGANSSIEFSIQVVSAYTNQYRISSIEHNYGIVRYKINYGIDRLASSHRVAAVRVDDPVVWRPTRGDRTRHPHHLALVWLAEVQLRAVAASRAVRFTAEPAAVHGDDSEDDHEDDDDGETRPDDDERNLGLGDG